MDKQSTASEFQGMLEARGVSRRSFMKLCGTLAVMAGLGEAAAPRVAQALEESVIGASQGDLYPVIWIEGASCTGCTEAFAQIDAPDAAAVVLELISLNYSETLSAAAGHSMEKAKEQTIEAGNYILVYEGAVLNGWNGNALRVAGKTGNEHLIEAAEKATAVVALGSCAVNGGWMAAAPNASNATGVQAFLKEQGINVPIINIPGCPPNPEWLCAVLIQYLLLGTLPVIAFVVLRRKPIQSGEQPESTMPRSRQLILAAVFSLIIGLYDGLYGPGTGTFLLMLYTGLCKMSLERASGTVKLVNLSSNITSFVLFLTTGQVLVTLGLIFGGFCLLGHVIGSGMMMKNGSKIVRPVIITVLALLFIKVISDMMAG